MSENNTLLSIEDLSVHFFTEDGLAKAVEHVSFSIPKGKTFALVGESGCGKSVTALSTLQLIPDPPGKIISGKIIMDGQDLLELSKKQMRSVRGNDIAMIFQEPMTSLNPVFTVGDQIIEAIRLHQKKSPEEAHKLAVEMLSSVGIGDAEKRVYEYPHQMSGGMRQRVMIAMAISCRPQLLIADEPTTALDVTIQAQILDLLDELQQKNNMSILLITHDLGIVAERADEIAVMYASQIVEQGDAKSIFGEPMHPYTKGLLKSVPRLGFEEERLDTVQGNVPNPLHFPSGCKFHPRCPIGCNDEKCKNDEPSLKEVKDGRLAACWYAPGY